MGATSLQFKLTNFTTGEPLSGGRVQSVAAPTGRSLNPAITSTDAGGAAGVGLSNYDFPVTYLITLPDGHCFHIPVYSTDETIELGELSHFPQGVAPQVADITAFVDQIRVNGAYATGYLNFVSNPANNETIAINGVTLTFKNTPTLDTDVQRGANASLTEAALLTFLQASINTSLDDARCSSINTRIRVVFKTTGATGNAFTLADSSAGAIVASNTTLTGGADGSLAAALAAKQGVLQTVVTSAAATVSPTNADSGTFYNLTNANPAFDMSAITTVGWHCSVKFSLDTLGTLDAGTGRLVQYLAWNGTSIIGLSAQSALAYQYGRYDITYSATNTFSINGVCDEA